MSRHNPWTSIADLFSGMVVVVLVLFASSAAIPRLRAAAAQHPAPSRGDGGAPPPTPAQVRARQQEQFLDVLAARLAPFVALQIIDFDRGRRLVEFKDVSFRRGSACLVGEATHAIGAIASTIAGQLETDQTLTVHLEGHSDAVQIHGLLHGCGWFEDNTQLSTLRAANVRRVIAAGSSPAVRARLAVTGWGPDHLKNPRDPNAAENRRVELRFVWLSDADQGDGGRQASSATQ